MNIKICICLVAALYEKSIGSIIVNDYNIINAVIKIRDVSAFIFNIILLSFKKGDKITERS